VRKSWLAGLVCLSLGTAYAANGDVEAQWRKADSQLAEGAASEAEQTLKIAALLAKTDAERAGTALRLGAAFVRRGNLAEATRELTLAQQLSSALSPTDARRLPVTQGLLAARQGDFLNAERQFEAAAAAEKSGGSLSGEVQARVDALRARFDRSELADLEPRLAALYNLAMKLPRADASARLLVAVANLHRTAVNEFLAPVALRRYAYTALETARTSARYAGTRAFALGFLGALYEDEKRWAEAESFTSQAAFAAQSAGAFDQLYRWEWQLARIQRGRGALVDSQAALERAVSGFSDMRADVLQSTRGAYRTLVEPLYLDYADVNLKQAAKAPPGSEAEQKLLRDVRNKLESLKQAEVQDYFETACVANSADAGFNMPGAAVVYPILLGDRVEVLVETGGKLRRFAAAVPGAQAVAAVRQMRLGLERAGNEESYLVPAKALYGWLMAGADQWLAGQKVDTLIVVPSGALRTVPYSALHDGKQYLVEKYAVVTTPAVSFIASRDSTPIDRLMVGGLTQGVQGFSQLPGVAQELSDVGSLYSARALRDETFQLSTVSAQLASADYSAAHLATHGEFNSDHRKSFILTYDNRLTMDGLRTALTNRKEPLDLLVLSACKTAAGDDRAALGLAGVAVQAGARSALASLWYISDRATANLMTAFYKDLRGGKTNKAQSLRNAQLALLRSNDFKHPTYWAPYLLIGNWL
jgi:CHAT domain-containing protein